MVSFIQFYLQVLNGGVWNPKFFLWILYVHGGNTSVVFRIPSPVCVVPVL